MGNPYMTREQAAFFKKRIAFHLVKDDGQLTYWQLQEIFPRCDSKMFYEVARELGYGGLQERDLLMFREAKDPESRKADWKYRPNRRASFLAWRERRAREAKRQGLWVFDAIKDGE